MPTPAHVQFFIAELPNIGKRHEDRLARRSSGNVSHVDIDAFFRDVDTLRAALRRVNYKNLAGLRLLSNLYDEMYCHSDAYCVRKLTVSLFPRYASSLRTPDDIAVCSAAHSSAHTCV